MRDEWYLSRLTAEGDTTRPDREVARIAAEAWGAVSLEELRACGLSSDAVTSRVQAGWLHRHHRTVYAVGHPALPLEGRFLAAVKACGPDALLSHHCAVVHLGLAAWEEREIDVTVAGTTPRRHPGIRVHRTTRLDRSDVSRRRGIPVTAPARTLLDVAGTPIPAAGLRRLVRAAQAQRLASVSSLADVLARHPGRRGASRLAALLADGPAPTRSELEDVVLDLIVRSGLARPDVNRALFLDGRRVVPDFRWPAARLVLEADGARWHEGRLAVEDDAERQARLEAHGERVIRVTWAQAVRSPAQTLARLRAAGAPVAS